MQVHFRTCFFLKYLSFKNLLFTVDILSSVPISNSEILNYLINEYSPFLKSKVLLQRIFLNLTVHVFN